MIVARRRQFVKWTLCSIYVIGVIVIARRIIRASYVPDIANSINRNDSFNSPERVSNDEKHSGFSAVGTTSRVDKETQKKSVFFCFFGIKHKIKGKLIIFFYRYEQWISRWERRMVKGLGDGGKASSLYGREKAKAQKILEKKALNVLLSDKIPLTRKLPDVRDPL